MSFLVLHFPIQKYLKKKNFIEADGGIEQFSEFSVKLKPGKDRSTVLLLSFKRYFLSIAQN